MPSFLTVKLSSASRIYRSHASKRYCKTQSLDLPKMALLSLLDLKRTPNPPTLLSLCQRSTPPRNFGKTQSIGLRLRLLITPQRKLRQAFPRIEMTAQYLLSTAGTYIIAMLWQAY